MQGHEATRREVSQVREQMEETKKEMDLLLANTRGRQRRAWSDDEDEVEENGNGVHDDDDDDDTRSVSTVTANDNTTDRGQTQRKRIGKAELVAQNATLAAKVESLTAEIADIVELSKSLKTQHGEAMSAVETLAARVGSLESGFAGRIAEEVGKTEHRWEQWRLKFEDDHKKDRESWEAERERLRGVVREWEEASRRAHEEEEDRALNEELSGEEPGEEDLAQLDGDLQSFDDDAPTMSTSRKSRRRRPSHRTALAIDALKAVADGQGSATPKQAETSRSSRSVRRGGLPARTTRASKNDMIRSGSTSTLQGDKESSESGKESGDTVQDGHELHRPPRPRVAQVRHSLYAATGVERADLFSLYPSLPLLLSQWSLELSITSTKSKSGSVQSVACPRATLRPFCILFMHTDNLNVQKLSHRVSRIALQQPCLMSS